MICFTKLNYASVKALNCRIRKNKFVRLVYISQSKYQDIYGLCDIVYIMTELVQSVPLTSVHLKMPPPKLPPMAMSRDNCHIKRQILP